MNHAPDGVTSGGSVYPYRWVVIMNEMFRSKDFWSGALMIAIGASFLLLSFGYSFGDASGIGPAAFPAVVASLLILVGCLLVIRAGIAHGGMVEGIHWRPLTLVVASVVAFGILLPLTGLGPATVVLVLLGALAMPGFGLRDALLAAAIVTVFGYIVFVWALKLPIPFIQLSPGF